MTTRKVPVIERIMGANDTQAAENRRAFDANGIHVVNIMASPGAGKTSLILETVKRLNKDGMTIIYTSHYMDEVEFLCDRVGIIDHGRVIALGTQEELRKMVGDADRVVVSLPADSADAEAAETEAAEGADSGQTASPAEPAPAGTALGAATAMPQAVLEAVRGLAGVTGVERTDGALTVLAKDGGATLAPLMATLTAAGVRVHSVSIDKPDLESVFLSLTGRSLRD